MDILPSSWSNVPTMKVCYCQYSNICVPKAKYHLINVSNEGLLLWIQPYLCPRAKHPLTSVSKQTPSKSSGLNVVINTPPAEYLQPISLTMQCDHGNGHAVEAGSYGQHSFCRHVGYAFNIVETVSMYLYSTFWIFFCIVFSIFVLWHYLIVKCLFCYIYCLDCHFKAVYICMSGDISRFWLSCLGPLCALYLISTLSLKTYLFLFTCMIL